MHKFIKTRDQTNPHDSFTVEISADGVSLQEVLHAFENYLKACGFSFRGSLDFVEDE